VFYSELTQQLGNVKATKAPGVQWKAIINGLKQKGVKQDEIEWSGVMEWLLFSPHINAGIAKSIDRLWPIIRLD
jgi:hypothetical protein